MESTLVVIPYLAKAAQGCELELAVAGWLKFFTDPLHLIIVGDRDDNVDRAFENAPKLSKNGRTELEFISCPQIEPVEGEYLPHLDHVHKFRRVHEEYPDTEGFVYACDDMYAMRPFGLSHIKQVKVPSDFVIPPFDWEKEKGWWRDLGKTRDLCFREGYPERNYVCHLPVYYRWDWLLDIYDRYDCDHVSYIVENIYFNKHYDRSEPWWYDTLFHDEVRTAIPGLRPVGSVTWVTNANCGWSRRLEDILRKHYGIWER